MDAYSALQSAFQAGYDNENLYIGFRADEPLIARHLEHAKSKDTGKVNWEYQLCEVFLDVPTAEGTTNHYQLSLDLLGHQSTHVTDPAGQPGDAGAGRWKEASLPWKGAVRLGSDFYSMEIVVPFKALGRTPGNCETWGFQIGRHGTWAEGLLKGLHWKVASWTAWAPMPSGAWRTVNEHGILEFADQVLLADEQNVGKRTRAINQAYDAWKATHGAAMLKVQAMLDQTRGLVDLCYGTNNAQQAACLVFGTERGAPSRGKVDNWTWLWWFDDTGNPQTATLTWKEPVTFNCNRIEWGSPTCYGRDYALEYWTGTEWKTAYHETNGCLSLAGHAFPAVTTRKARLTIARTVSDCWNVTLQGFALYRIPDETPKGERP